MDNKESVNKNGSSQIECSLLEKYVKGEHYTIVSNECDFKDNINVSSKGNILKSLFNEEVQYNNPTIQKSPLHIKAEEQLPALDDDCTVDSNPNDFEDETDTEKHSEFFCTPKEEIIKGTDESLQQNKVANEHFFKRDKVIAKYKSQLECDMCCKTFPLFRNLKAHYKEEHNTEGYAICCNQKYHKFDTFVRHIGQHLNPEECTCDVCGKLCTTKWTLKSHKKQVHEKIKEIRVPRDIKKSTYRCEECGILVTSSRVLEHHRATYHKGVSTVFICNICGKVSVTEWGIKRHKNYVHKAERKLKCPHCDRAFTYQRILREHMTTHTGKAIYECTHCPKSFKASSSYYRHLEKNHPAEWELHKKNRLEKRKIDSDQVTSLVVM